LPRNREPSIDTFDGSRAEVIDYSQTRRSRVVLHF
jgi:hypothetical protein